LPVGVEGEVTLLLEDKDGIKAGYLMLKRGCRLSVINNGNIDFSLLRKYSYGEDIKEVSNINKNSKALVVSDKLNNIKDYDYDILILRPLLGYKKVVI